mgnify:FL=1
MLEAVLRGLTSLDGVRTVLFVEDDGFVVHAHPMPHGIEASVIETWKALAKQAAPDALTTLVMEEGYLMLKPVETRVLMTVCARACNLGKVRRALESIQWPK